MRTRKISQLEETTSNVSIQDQVTLINSSPLNNYRVTVNDFSETLASTLWVQNELDGGFSVSVPGDNIDADLGAEVQTEIISDGQWGSTYWKDYVFGDGTKDRMVTNWQQWGTNNEEFFWEVEGPNTFDCMEMRDVITSEGVYTGAAQKWQQAVMRLVGTPNTYDEIASTWSTGSYGALGNGDARVGKPFTVTSTWSTAFNNVIGNTFQHKEMDGVACIWATSANRKHYTKHEGTGFRLQQIHGRVTFQIGCGGRDSQYMGRVDGYLKLKHGRSANVDNQSNPGGAPLCYQDPFEHANNSTDVYQTMDPYDVAEDSAMWYQITVAYDGGPIGYYNYSTRSETESQLVENIRGSFKFYQTNLRTGKVEELEWHHLQVSNRWDCLGVIQGIGYSGDRSGNTFFGVHCDSNDNAFCFKSNWGGTWATNTALSQSDLQGDSNRLNGFAMDPIGWSTVNNKNATNTWAWIPSHHWNRTNTSVNKDNYYNETTDNDPSNQLIAKADMKNPGRHIEQLSYSHWANNYPADTP